MCPFYSMNYLNGSMLPTCGYNYWRRIKLGEKDLTDDCLSFESISCPFHESRNETVIIRRQVRGCVHCLNGRCGVELVNGDIHDPMCGAADSGKWEECEAAEFDTVEPPRRRTK